MKLAIVLSHPTQYYSPWFRYIASHSEVEIRVFYLWTFGVNELRDPQFGTKLKWDVDLLTGYQHEFVPNIAKDPGTHHFRGLNNPSLVQRIREWRPDAALLFGYNSVSHLRAIALLRAAGIPLLFRGDSHFLGGRRPSWPKRVALRTLYRQFRGLLAVGVANTAYFRALGAPTRKIFRAPHAVDDSLYDPANAMHHDAAASLRGSLALRDDQRVVLFAGKLIPAKQPVELGRAFIELQRPNTVLVFVGEGSEKPALQSLAQSSPTSDIRFLPFANQSAMPARYLIADVFALPSRGLYETWGLAVNEAMHMGAPALVSERVGCQQDLVVEGETGWVFPTEQLGGLTAALDRALVAVANSVERARLATAVKQRVSGYSYAAATAGLLAALNTCCRGTRA